MACILELNPVELSEKMKTLYDNIELSASMGNKARKFIEDTFSEVNFYKNILSNYKNIILWNQ